MVACALSHLAVWEQVADGDGRPCLVLEDDARLITGFVDQLAAVRLQLSELDESADLAYIGYSSWRGPGARPHPAQSVTVRPMDWSDHMGGCFGYLLFRPGARSLLGRAARTAFTTASTGYHATSGTGSLRHARRAAPGSPRRSRCPDRRETPTSNTISSRCGDAEGGAAMPSC